uniref:Uncharacterized protein n=1 Tax=Rhizophora mucronata TaxID=61149 RepID=A0A2P2LPD1_RHIMU
MRKPQIHDGVNRSTQLVKSNCSVL